MIEKVSKPVVIKGFGKMGQVADAFRRNRLVFAIGHQILLVDAAFPHSRRTRVALKTAGTQALIGGASIDCRPTG
jgi:hypothetical protein